MEINNSARSNLENYTGARSKFVRNHQWQSTQVRPMHSRKSEVVQTRDAHNSIVNILQYTLPRIQYIGIARCSNTIYCYCQMNQYNIFMSSGEAIQYIYIVWWSNTIYLYCLMKQYNILLRVEVYSTTVVRFCTCQAQLLYLQYIVLCPIIMIPLDPSIRKTSGILPKRHSICIELK
jgi:hypothetical protein